MFCASWPFSLQLVRLLWKGFIEFYTFIYYIHIIIYFYFILAVTIFVLLWALSLLLLWATIYIIK